MTSGSAVVNVTRGRGVGAACSGKSLNRHGSLRNCPCLFLHEHRRGLRSLIVAGNNPTYRIRWESQRASRRRGSRTNVDIKNNVASRVRYGCTGTSASARGNRWSSGSPNCFAESLDLRSSRQDCGLKARVINQLRGGRVRGKRDTAAR